jgi:hypothetical protein
MKMTIDKRGIVAASVPEGMGKVEVSKAISPEQAKEQHDYEHCLDGIMDDFLIETVKEDVSKTADDSPNAIFDSVIFGQVSP